MLRVKNKDVHVAVFSPAIMHILNTLYGLNQEQIPDYPKDFVITSVNDSKHMVGSKHYTDEAIDLRSKNFNDMASKYSFKELLELRLGKKFRVLFEYPGKINEHFHIQVKRGAKFP